MFISPVCYYYKAIVPEALLFVEGEANRRRTDYTSNRTPAYAYTHSHTYTYRCIWCIYVCILCVWALGRLQACFDTFSAASVCPSVSVGVIFVNIDVCTRWIFQNFILCEEFSAISVSGTVLCYFLTDKESIVWLAWRWDLSANKSAGNLSEQVRRREIRLLFILQYNRYGDFVCQAAYWLRLLSAKKYIISSNWLYNWKSCTNFSTTDKSHRLWTLHTYPEYNGRGT